MSETVREISPAILPLVYLHSFTNQQLIDAFFFAANNLPTGQANAGDYEGLLRRATLDINQLAADRGGHYGGAQIVDLPNLSSDERQLIYQGLLSQLQRAGKAARVNAPAGLNLRSGPGTDHETLVSLVQGSDLTVLGEDGDWLLVGVGEQNGWVAASFVDRNPSAAAAITNNGGAPSAFSGSLEASDHLDAGAGASPEAMAAAATWNNYGGLIQAESARLNFDPAVAVAILGVESSGRAFENNRMIIRFENHIFLAYRGKDHRDLFDLHFTGSSDGREHRFRPDPNGEWLPCHTNQDREWQTFSFARTLDESAAMYAISMGAAQVMGFNYASIGYGTVQAMFNAFQADIRNQLGALFRFIEVNHLQDAVRTQDFVAFAHTYNGAGQEAIYAPRMQRYYDAYHQLVASRDAIARLPRPGIPPLLQADPELAAAWRKHVVTNFANMQTLFHSILNSFLRPYWTTVWMYRILFALGVCSFVLAAALAIFRGHPVAVFTFSGISAITVLGYFFNRPTQALEQNLQFLTWLGIIYNSYWTEMTLLNNEQSVQGDIGAVTDKAIEQIKALVAEHAIRSQGRQNLGSSQPPNEAREPSEASAVSGQES